jgi:uncharacterized protein DUF1573
MKTYPAHQVLTGQERRKDAVRKVHVLALVFAIVAGGATCRSGVPVLSIDGAEVVLKPILRGEGLEHTFRVRNTGQSTLTIESLAADCGSEATISRSVLGAGEDATIKVKYWTRNLAEGVSPMAVRFRTNDPSRRQVSLRSLVSVRSEFELSVQAIDIGLTRQGASETRQMRVLLKNPSQRVLHVTSSDPVLDARLTPIAADVQMITLSVRSDASPGSHFGAVILTTSSGLTPELRVPVRGRIGAE